MTSVDQLGIDTVINKKQFSENVLVKECPVVGRSLVANRSLVPGDVVLVEEPLIKYDLKPKSRSSKSPYYSKKLWNMLVEMVHEQENEGKEEEETHEQTSNDEESDDYSDSYDSQDDSDDDEEDEEEEEINTDSDFCPGVPAAIIGYLDIYPPKSFNNVKIRRTYKQNDFDFFYYPDTDTEPAWLDHKTIRLIHIVTQKVVDTIPLFAHVDAYDLRSFVLKIYSNAHTVALPRSRVQPTHQSRKARRAMYKEKFGDNATYWGEDAVEPPSIPTIALLRWGSKFAHSCSPNMFLRFEPDRNAMVFTVTRPLKEGEILSFSYLPEDDTTVGGLVCGNVFDRRAKLQKFKFFECACERCVDWDWSRGVTCNACHEPTSFRDDQGVWTCFVCQTRYGDEEATFIGDRESNVQRMVMGFAARIHGQRRMNESMMRMLEPYLLDLLSPAPEKNEVAVPKNHWTYGIIQSLLAAYHLKLFPQSFGKGLASQLGLTVQGLEEAANYIDFLNDTIRTHRKSTTSHGNPMAAFFAGWRVLSLVIDLVMDSTENKYANVVYERDSDSEDEESVASKKETLAEETTVDNEPVLVPMPQEWTGPVTRISNTVNSEWIPLVQQIFKSSKSVVVEDMLAQIKGLADRIEKCATISGDKQ